MIRTDYQPRPVTQPAVTDHYDVIIIGGGPAGATAAALVAEAGHSVLVLERLQVPRFHVGESLIPDTYWTLKRLGLLEQLKQSAFPKKYSVQFISADGRESAPFYFDEYNPHESSQTWQVERGDFDKLLLDNAVSKGAVLRSDAHVLDVLFDGQQAVGVRVKLTDCLPGEAVAGSMTDRQEALAPGGERVATVREIRSRVIIDASGQTAFLANRLGLKKPDPRLRKGTVWSYWENAHREPGERNEGATLILSTKEKNSWFWYIPLSDNITSIGCTGDMEYMFNKSRGTPADVYQQELERCPGLQKRLTEATRVRDHFTTKDFSYVVTQPAGPGWVLVGDACGFIDPIYSSGVFLALKSAELVADAVTAGLAANDVSAERLGAWYADYARGEEMFHKLVYAFYTREFNFAEFLRKSPQYKSAVTDILVGNVFRPGLEEMFQAMEEQFPQTLAGWNAAMHPQAQTAPAPLVSA